MNEQHPKRLRGFAAMSPEKRKAIAQLGGRSAQIKGTGHTFTSDEARAAGRLGKRGKAKKGNV